MTTLSDGMEVDRISRTCGLETNRNTNGDNIAEEINHRSPVHVSEWTENDL